MPRTVDTRAVGRLELLPVVAVDSPLPDRRLSCAELSAVTFIDFPTDWANRIRVDELFADHGVVRDVAVEVMDTSMAIELVRAGLGVAFLPRSIVEGRDDLRTVLLDVPTLSRRLVLARASRRQALGVEAVHSAMIALASATTPGSSHDASVAADGRDDGGP